MCSSYFQGPGHRRIHLCFFVSDQFSQMSNSGKLSVEELPPITFDQTPNLTTDYIATCHPSTASCLCGAQKPMWALKITDMVLLGEFSTLDGAAVIYRNKD